MKTSSVAPMLVAHVSETSHANGTSFENLLEEHNRRRLRLTPREHDVLRLLCEGLPNKLIERRLNIGAGTVKCHVASILSKLGVASRLQAVVAAHRLGLLVEAESQPAATESECEPPKSGLVAVEPNGVRRINRMSIGR